MKRPLDRIIGRAREFADSFLFGACLTDPELGRRARLISRFGLLGFLFGLMFAVFYLLIGHYWGTRIVAVCSLGFVATPFLMRTTRSLTFAGNLLAAIMTAGFAALCSVEGGLSGHAIAWLVVVPLCALLLVGKEPAKWWLLICFVTASAIIAMALAGVELRDTIPPRWQMLVSATGYLALILFMFCLGMIFESGRERAFNKMQEALGRLEASNEQLVNLNNEKNEFLGIAAHDLKNPLTTIILGAEMLRMTNNPERTPKLADTILNASTRMRDLITNLLDANAIEEGRFTSNLERCDLGALLAQCVEHNGPAAARKEIALEVAADGEVWARADRTATMQILDNFISNAIKYSPYKSAVRLRAAALDGQVSVAITDEGPGLSAEDQQKLFRKFTRLSAKPTGGESSNGLGLSIVKRLAEAMGGSVTCQSSLGNGSTFTVHLPAWTEASAAAVKN
ncbi:MAG TPA: HAMP domain-containing sensor histidine kinase [bacterium]|nr:HAMP domain-containing sensor histidine kinase [bacterium]